MQFNNANFKFLFYEKKSFKIGSDFVFYFSYVF